MSGEARPAALGLCEGRSRAPPCRRQPRGAEFFFFEFYLKKNSIPAFHLDTFISLCLSRSQIHGNLFLSSYFVILFAPLLHAAPSSPLLPALALTFYESPCVFPLPWS